MDTQTTGTDKVTVLLADDHGILREGLRNLLEEYDDLVVVDEATTGAEAVEKVKALKPQILLLDLIMPEMGGVEVLEALAAEHLSTRVIVLTGADDDDLLARSIQSGAMGYLLKDAASNQLVDAIRTVALGGCWLPADLTGKLFRGMSRKSQTADGARLSLLTARELEVLKLLGEAKTNSEIADQLFISEHTAKVHVSRILEKLALSTRIGDGQVCHTQWHCRGMRNTDAVPVDMKTGHSYSIRMERLATERQQALIRILLSIVTSALLIWYYLGQMAIPIEERSVPDDLGRPIIVSTVDLGHIVALISLFMVYSLVVWAALKWKPDKVRVEMAVTSVVEGSVDHVSDEHRGPFRNTILPVVYLLRIQRGEPLRMAVFGLFPCGELRVICLDDMRRAQ